MRAPIQGENEAPTLVISFEKIQVILKKAFPKNLLCNLFENHPRNIVKSGHINP